MPIKKIGWSLVIGHWSVVIRSFHCSISISNTALQLITTSTTYYSLTTYYNLYNLLQPLQLITTSTTYRNHL